MSTPAGQRLCFARHAPRGPGTTGRNLTFSSAPRNIRTRFSVGTIVRRGGAAIILKAVGVDPLPNCTREIECGIVRWDAYLTSRIPMH
jgi:hypothetical protein